MKYLKTYEDKKYNIAKEFRVNTITDLYYSVGILNLFDIPFDIYYFVFNGEMFFKLYSFSYISKDAKKLLKKNDFVIFDDDYSFTWDWQKINIEDIQILIDSKNYNL